MKKVHQLEEISLRKILLEFSAESSPSQFLGISEQGLDKMCRYSYELMRSGEVEKASDALFLLYHLAPQHLEIALGFGNAEQLRGHLDTAIAVYQASLMIDVDEPRTYIFLAQCSILKKEIRNAENFLEIAEEHIKERREYEHLLPIVKQITKSIK